jgi:hypothetical protein
MKPGHALVRMRDSTPSPQLRSASFPLYSFHCTCCPPPLVAHSDAALFAYPSLPPQISLVASPRLCPRRRYHPTTRVWATTSTFPRHSHRRRRWHSSFPPVRHRAPPPCDSPPRRRACLLPADDWKTVRRRRPLAFSTVWSNSSRRANGLGPSPALRPSPARALARAPACGILIGAAG